MFGRKKIRKAEDRAERAELELKMTSMRLAQYDSLMASLRKHDWFEFNASGGLIAHDKNDNFGTAYIWPDPEYRCTITY